ncbi:MAG: Fic family protein [Rickettsiales bacterium]|jgi:death-on-curing protein|nr:Fic family protein [Rickettsiales bacterium]
MNFKTITAEHIVLIHNSIDSKGGINGSIDSCFASAEYYNTVELKISSIVRSLVKNHYFLDGNKRTSAVVYVLLCEENNLKPKSDDELGNIMLKIAVENMSVEDITKILFDNF